MEPKINLWPSAEKGNSTLTPFLLQGNEPRPAILVIPGGGYACVCEQTEGTPVALRFNQLGYHAFVLDYRVAPNTFPAPLEDAVRAVRIIRGNAQAWKVIPDKIASCGFSAGAHLAGCLGTMTDKVNANANDRYDTERSTVDAMLLCYGVLIYDPALHAGSWNNLTGNNPALAAQCSLDTHITEQTPPAFLWATMEDQLVNYRNSVIFAQAMADKKRPCELHLFPWGKHGMLLGLDTKDVICWPTEAKRFLDAQWEMRDAPEQVIKRYTNQYQVMAEVRDGMAKE